MPNFDAGAAGREVRVRGGIEPGVEPEADAPSGPEERVERAERLRVDECSAAGGRDEVRIGLSDAVDDDPIGRRAGAQGHGELDRSHHLEAEALASQT